MRGEMHRVWTNRLAATMGGLLFAASAMFAAFHGSLPQLFAGGAGVGQSPTGVATQPAPPAPVIGETAVPSASPILASVRPTAPASGTSRRVMSAPAAPAGAVSPAPTAQPTPYYPTASPAPGDDDDGSHRGPGGGGHGGSGPG
jgi:hypothetical protein